MKNMSVKKMAAMIVGAAAVLAVVAVAAVLALAVLVVMKKKAEAK